jgi:hypothetical protein
VERGATAQRPDDEPARLQRGRVGGAEHAGAVATGGLGRQERAPLVEDHARRVEAPRVDDGRLGGRGRARRGARRQRRARGLPERDDLRGRRRRARRGAAHLDRGERHRDAREADGDGGRVGAGHRDQRPHEGAEADAPHLDAVAAGRDAERPAPRRRREPLGRQARGADRVGCGRRRVRADAAEADQRLRDGPSVERVAHLDLHGLRVRPRAREAHAEQRRERAEGATPAQRARATRARGRRADGGGRGRGGVGGAEGRQGARVSHGRGAGAGIAGARQAALDATSSGSSDAPAAAER